MKLHSMAIEAVALLIAAGSVLGATRPQPDVETTPAAAIGLLQWTQPHKISSLSEADTGCSCGDSLDHAAMNRLAIQYVRGTGARKDYRQALKIFRVLAMEGYTPGMVNLGTLYEFGAVRRPNHRLAYAWIRAALALGVPKDDYDATLFKLGMIAGKIGTANLDVSERLAASLADAIAIQIGEPATRADPLPTRRRAW